MGSEFNHEIEKILNDMIRFIDPAILNQCKSYFEKNLPYMQGNKLELTLIIDTNMVISDAMAYVKRNKSFLLELSKSHFLTLLAPTWLKEELEKKIPEISRKYQLDENTFRLTVSMFLEKIRLIDLTDNNAYQLAFSKVGNRDVKDVPYVSLFLTVKSHGILTKDKDIKEIPNVKVWERPGIAGRVISIFEKGTLSFAIAGMGLPLVFRFLYEIFISILKTVWEVTKMFISFIYSLLKEGFKAFSKAPDWVKILIALGLFLLMSDDKKRESIMNALKSIVEGVTNLLRNFYEKIREIMAFLSPLIEFGLAILYVLFKKIEETIVTYQQINLSQTNIQNG